MKRFKFRRRTWVLLAVLVAAAVAAVSGYAYFVTSGSGTGTATVATPGGITIWNDDPGGLWPDSAWHSMNVYLNVPGGGNQYVTSVSGNVATYGGCLGTFFEVYTIPVNSEETPGTHTLTGYVRMLTNESLDQTPLCEGAPMTINWSSN